MIDTGWNQTAPDEQPNCTGASTAISATALALPEEARLCTPLLKFRANAGQSHSIRYPID
jgi:hypothetical protein